MLVNNVTNLLFLQANANRPMGPGGKVKYGFMPKTSFTVVLRDTI